MSQYSIQRMCTCYCANVSQTKAVYNGILVYCLLQRILSYKECGMFTFVYMWQYLLEYQKLAWCCRGSVPCETSRLQAYFKQRVSLSIYIINFSPSNLHIYLQFFEIYFCEFFNVFNRKLLNKETLKVSFSLWCSFTLSHIDICTTHVLWEVLIEVLIKFGHFCSSVNLLIILLVWFWSIFIMSGL